MRDRSIRFSELVGVINVPWGHTKAKRRYQSRKPSRSKHPEWMNNGPCLMKVDVFLGLAVDCEPSKCPSFLSHSVAWNQDSRTENTKILSSAGETSEKGRAKSRMPKP